MELTIIPVFSVWCAVLGSLFFVIVDGMDHELLADLRTTTKGSSKRQPAVPSPFRKVTVSRGWMGGVVWEVGVRSSCALLVRGSGHVELATAVSQRPVH